jgi:Ca2+-binding RTX toxin-like protein
MALSLKFSGVEHGTGFVHGTVTGTFTVNVTESAGSLTGTWTYSGNHAVVGIPAGGFSVSGTLESTSNTGSGDLPSWNLLLKMAEGAFVYSAGSGDLWRNENGTYELSAQFTDSINIPGEFPLFIQYQVFASRMIGVSSLPNTGTEGADVLVGTAAPESFLAKGGNDKVNAAGGNDTVDGGAGNDSLDGGAGDDILLGGTGIDTMRGGTGDDTYYVDSAGDRVIETSNVPTALVLPGSGGTGHAGLGGITDTVISLINYSVATLGFIENITLTGAASRATGNELANQLMGNEGTDTLVGAGGNDTLDGGAGSDSIDGGAGDDTIVWGAGDKLNGGANTDTLRIDVASVDLSNNTANPNSRLLNFEQVDLGAGAHTLKLNATDVLDLSSTSTIKILGDASDTVNIVGTQSAGTAVAGGYTRYTIGAAILIIDSDITVM